jgi:hypothetical protein
VPSTPEWWMSGAKNINTFIPHAERNAYESGSIMVQSLNHNYPSNQQPRLCRHPWNTYFWGMLRCFKQAVSLMARLHDKAGTIGRWRRCLERTSTACKVPRLAAVSCCHGLCRLIWAKDGTSQGARVWLVIYGHTSEAQRSLPTLDWTGCKMLQERAEPDLTWFTSLGRSDNVWKRWSQTTTKSVKK